MHVFHRLGIKRRQSRVIVIFSDIHILFSKTSLTYIVCDDNPTADADADVAS